MDDPALAKIAAQAPARAVAQLIATGDDDRTPIMITPKEHEVISQVVEALADRATHAPLFQRAGQLVHVLADEHGNAQPKIVELPQAHLRTLISSRVRFVGERSRKVKTPRPTLDHPKPRRPRVEVEKPKRPPVNAPAEDVAAFNIQHDAWERAKLDQANLLVDYERERREYEEAREQHEADVRAWRTEQKDAITIVEDKHPPDWCVKGLAARGHWPSGIRPLDGFSEVPFLRPDGSIVETAGYDASTRTILVPNAQFFPTPKTPSRDEARDAADKLLDLVHDFPFEGAAEDTGATAHRSGWLAAYLTPFVRHAFRGPTPLFLVDANVRGAGKSKLTDTIAELVLGRPMARAPQATHEDEERKRITSVLLAAPQLVLIDNIDRILGSAPLDAVLTAEEWSDRILGKSDQSTIIARPCWYGTGNNVRIKSDTARRVQHIRLASPLENPEQRTAFRFPHLIEHVRAQRAAFVRYALIILRAWYHAGAPAPAKPLRSWGSYERWSGIVRHAIVWIGEPDPGESRAALELYADTESNALADLLGGWVKVCEERNTTSLTIGEALAELESQPHAYQRLRDALSELLPTKPGQLPSARSVGMVFHHLRERVQDGRKLVHGGTVRGAARWTVTTVTDEAAAVRDYGTRGLLSKSGQESDQKSISLSSSANANAIAPGDGADADPSSPVVPHPSPAPPPQLEIGGEEYPEDRPGSVCSYCGGRSPVHAFDCFYSGEVGP